MTHKTKWLILAPSGLIVIGAGACLIGWATTLKNRGAATGKWVAAGTAALTVFNAGLSLFGRSIMEKTLYELREEPLASTPTYHAISQL
jgi:hypothetical protein